MPQLVVNIEVNTQNKDCRKTRIIVSKYGTLPASTRPKIMEKLTNKIEK